MKKENFDKAKQLLSERKMIDNLINYYGNVDLNNIVEKMQGLSISMTTFSPKVTLVETNIHDFRFGNKFKKELQQKLIDFCQSQGEVILRGIKNILDQEIIQIEKELDEL